MILIIITEALLSILYDWINCHHRHPWDPFNICLNLAQMYILVP